MRHGVLRLVPRRPPPPSLGGYGVEACGVRGSRPLVAGARSLDAAEVAETVGCTRRRFATATQPTSRRRESVINKFSLDRETPDEKAPRFKLADAPDEDRNVIALDRITEQQVRQLWPPAALLNRPEDLEPNYENVVKRPHLWLHDQSTVGVSDVGRFVKLPRDDLLQLLPEGPCGELARDMALIIERARPIGIMLRKLTVELMMQLSEAQDATDSRGEPRIRKAGFLLDGRRGVGKSQILNLLVMWARRNGWLVVMEPTPGRYSREIADIKRSNCGVYIQNEFSQQFLEATSIANRQMFEEIPVDMAVYGSRAIDGEPAREARRLYDPLIGKTVDQEVAAQGLSEAERLRRVAAYRRQVRMPSMAEQLQKPMTLWHIVEFGLENEAYATQAVAEMFAQLQCQTTHPVLVVVDQWNECFPVSEYVSIRYDNTRFHGHIPAYHLTMPRALHRWDGHLYKRGMKICATSWMHYTRREFRPELLGVKPHEIRTVRAFCPHEFANYVAYLRMMNVLHQFPRDNLEYFFMLTQGNGFQARKLLATLY